MENIKKSNSCVDPAVSEAGKKLRAAHHPARQAMSDRDDRVPKPKLGLPKDRLACIEDAAERLLNGEISGAAFKALVAGITRLGKDKTIQAMKPTRTEIPEFARPRKPAAPVNPPVEVPEAPQESSAPQREMLPSVARANPAWLRCSKCRALIVPDPARPQDEAVRCVNCGEVNAGH